MQVDVVERRLDLVHHVERRRAAAEHGEEVGQRRQLRSPPDSSDSFFTFLPLGLASTSMPVLSRSSGLVSTSRPLPPGNRVVNSVVKFALTSANAAANTLWISWSTAWITCDSSRRVARTSSSWDSRNSWRSCSSLNSSRASGLIGPIRRSSSSRSRARCAAGLCPRAAPVRAAANAASGSASRSRRSVSTVASRRIRTSASSISARCARSRSSLELALGRPCASAAGRVEALRRGRGTSSLCRRRISCSSRGGPRSRRGAVATSRRGGRRRRGRARCAGAAGLGGRTGGGVGLQPALGLGEAALARSCWRPCRSALRTSRSLRRRPASRRASSVELGLRRDRSPGRGGLGLLGGLQRRAAGPPARRRARPSRASRSSIGGVRPAAASAARRPAPTAVGCARGKASGGGGEAAVVGVEPALAGPPRRRAAVASSAWAALSASVAARLGQLARRAAARRPRRGRRAVAPPPAAPSRQPPAPKRSPSAVTTTASGWASAASSASSQPTDDDSAPSSTSSSAVDAGVAGADVAAHGSPPAAARAARTARACAEREHGAG